MLMGSISRSLELASSTGRPRIARPSRSAAHSIVSHSSEVLLDDDAEDSSPELSALGEGLGIRTRFLAVMPLLSMLRAVGLIWRLPSTECRRSDGESEPIAEHLH